MTHRDLPAPVLLSETVLHTVGGYTEVLRLRRLAVPPGRIAVQVVSRLGSARDPQAEQTRWQTTLDADALRRLGTALLQAASATEQA